ncbi:MAG: hypothetical protein GY786_13645 [Proteobacteria bacterium]|nr:hypothetical protein [Pseudomonadota bacterium]
MKHAGRNKNYNSLSHELRINQTKVQILEKTFDDLIEELRFAEKQFSGNEDPKEQLFLGLIHDLMDELRLTGKQIQSIESNLGNVIESLFEGEKGDQLRQTILQVMNLSLAHWEYTTKTTKIELAEQSKIWAVHFDKGMFRVRTFDKYLSSRSLPKRPRWRDVIRTARFVLSNNENQSPAMEKLKENLHQLQSAIYSST